MSSVVLEFPREMEILYLCLKAQGDPRQGTSFLVWIMLDGTILVYYNCYNINIMVQGII